MVKSVPLTSDRLTSLVLETPRLSGRGCPFYWNTTNRGIGGTAVCGIGAGCTSVGCIGTKSTGAGCTGANAPAQVALVPVASAPMAVAPEKVNTTHGAENP